MWKRALIFGALVALGGAIWTLLEFALGLHGENIETGQYTGFVSIIFPILGIVLAIRAAKKAEAGEFTWGDGFKQGMAVTAVFALLAPIFFYLYNTAINPGYVKASIDFAEAKLAGQGFSPREAEAAMAGTRAMASPAVQAITSLISALIGGAVISALAALFMRRKAALAPQEY